MNKRFNKPDDFSGMKPKKVESSEAPRYNEVGRTKVNKAESEWSSQMKNKSRE